jgi:hypothetical protein
MWDRLQGRLFNGLMRGDVRGLQDLAWRLDSKPEDMVERLAARGFLVVRRGDVWPHITIKGHFALLVRRLSNR